MGCLKDLTSGDCILGEHFARYVLGLNVTSRDAATKEQVMQAREYYAKNLGILVATNDDMNALRSSPAEYITRMRAMSVDISYLSENNIQRAHELLKSLSYDAAPGSWKPKMDNYVSFGIKPAAKAPLPAASDPLPPSGTTPQSSSAPALAAAAASAADPSFVQKYKWPLIIGGGGLLVLITVIIIVKS